MTELSQQINRIRAQNILSVAPLSQGRPSLFLSAKDAAGVDIDQVYDAALNGLKVLCQYDGRLSAFQDGILHSSSMNVQRELKTAAENKCLDKEISILLEHLSIFATEPSAHLVIEYLIRRYRVNEFNCDSLIRCLISTHDSKIFARAVQLCTISGTVWAFLEGVKNSGSPLPRSVIVSRCVRDTALLNSICQVSRSALALLSVDGNNKPKSAVIAGADRILSFLTATVIELADKGSLNDAQLRILYPFLVEGLKKSTEGSEEGKNGNSKIVFRAGGPTDQWRRSSCMIIAQVSRKTKLAKPLLKTLVGSLMSAFVSISGVTSGVSSSPIVRGVNSVLDAATEVLTIVAIVSQNQKVAMGPKMLMAIFSDISASSNSSIETSSDPDSSIPAARVGSAYILQCLEVLQKEKGFDTTSLFKVLTTTLTAALVTNIAEEMKNDPRYLSPMMASKILAYCISSGLLSDSIIGSILWTILQNNSLLGHIGTGLLKAPVPPSSGRRPRAESFSDDNDGDRKEVLRVLRCVSQRYPSIFDSCVQAAYRAVEGSQALEPEAEKMAVVDEDDDEEDMQVGLSLADINAEKLAKAALLRQLLSDTFTDAPYRMPSNTGVSLMLSLNSTSPLLRVQALETFAVTLPDECESSPDVKGLAQAASLSLTDYDPVVALAAWNSPVVSRIASHISPQDLLECTVSAYNWWAESMTRVPVRASRVLSMILATLSDKSISEVICRARTPTMNGSVWLFKTIIKCSIDSCSSSEAKDEKNVEGVKVAKKAKHLQIHALQCAQLLGASGIQQMFASISSATPSEGALPHETIAASVAMSLSAEEVSTDIQPLDVTSDSFLSKIGVIQTLHMASLSFLSKIDDSPSERSYASAYIIFLDDVLKHLAGCMLNGLKHAELSLRVCCALSVSMIARYVKISDSVGYKIPEGIIIALKNVIARAKSCNISNDITCFDATNTMSDLAASSMRELSAINVAQRLLLTILESSNHAVAALAGLCLGQLFGNNTMSILFLVSAPVRHSSYISADDSRLYLPLERHGCLEDGRPDFGDIHFSSLSLQITAKMRSSAVAAIAQFVCVINAGSNGVSLSAQQSAELIGAAAIAIGACSDDNEMIRSAGLLIAKALSALHPSLKIHLSSTSEYSDDGSKVRSVPITAVELILLGEYLHGSAGVILNDPQAVSAILAKKVFAEPVPGTGAGAGTGTGTAVTPKKGTRSQVLFDSLLALANIFGSRKPFICIPILTAASAAPLDSTWLYLRSLLTKPSGVYCARFSSAVMRCLATIHEAREDIQGDVVRCFCDLITSSEDSTRMGHVWNDVLKVLGEGWAIGLSNDKRSELFSALLKEQVRQSGCEDILLAIRNIPIDLSTAAALIEEGSSTFLQAHKLSSPSIEHEAALVSAVVQAFEVSQLKRFEEEEEALLPSGMSQALQRFCSVLEAMHTVLSSGKVMEEEESAYVRTIVASLLDVFQSLNDRRLKALLSVEYAKTIVADSIHFCLAAATNGALSTLFPTESKLKGKGKGKKSKDMIFDQARVAKDVEHVLLCLGSARSLQLQKASLRLLRSLILLCPETVALSVEVLGSLLASPSISAHLLAEAQDGSNDGLVGEILSTLVAAMPDKSNMEVEGVRDFKFLPQDILQPLCTRFLSVPSSRRSSLLRMAMGALGPCALPACTSVLLAHALSAYDPEGESAPVPGDGSQGGPQGGLILLSRSSQRKASRTLKSSQPEELFRLAIDSVLTKSAEAQVGTLVALVKSVQQLLRYAASSILLHEDQEVDPEEAGELILVEIDGVGEMILDVAKGQEYCEDLTASRQAERRKQIEGEGEITQVDKKGSATASLLLQLEFVFEVLENKTFHRQLLPLIEAESGSDTLQSYFLELSEQVLQLLALSTRAQGSVSSADSEKKKIVHSYLSVQLGDSTVDITVNSLGRSVNTWCLDILKATQKVLDAPSFVAILQELLSHEDPSVRQTALQILGKRLLAMSQGKRPGAEERALFLDLTSHLRAAVRGCLAPHVPPTGPDDMDTERDKERDRDSEQDGLGIAQSALMCLDILAKYLGSSPNWTITLADTLKEVVSFSSLVIGSIHSTDILRKSIPSIPTATPSKPSKKSKKAGTEVVPDLASADASAAAVAAAKQSYPELLKLQGSVFLSSGTICGAVGPRGLPFLAELLSNILSTIEVQGAQLLIDEKTRTTLIEALHAADLEANEDNTPVEMECAEESPLSDLSGYSYTVHRSSEDSSKKSKFMKKKTLQPPKGEKLLSKEDAAKLAAEVHSSEVNALCDDIDRCLSVMSSAIPPRLSVPILLDGASSILCLGHKVAEKFATLLGNVWGNLDRPTVLQHVAPLSSLATLILDYRRAYGDQSEAAAEVDITATDAVVQLCLKLTESELKALLARMAEWRDFERLSTSSESEVAPHSEGSWQKHSRGVSFYHLISQLSARLKSIFLPSMGLIWVNSVTSLQALTQFTSESQQDRSDLLILGDISGKKGKKRKADEEEGELEDATVTQRKAVSHELVLRCEHILSSVKAACVYDTEGFIDETRYGLMMPATADLVGLREAFSCEADYLLFVERHVCTCLSALARAVGRDVLWKPLNHRVLLLTRDSRKSVRIAAVKTLHKLFIEVGEEYLLLLPECLPFLSELLEDDAADVTSQTGELIRYIEELSGEKLDAYLQ